MEDPRIISALFISLKMAYYNVLINTLYKKEGSAIKHYPLSWFVHCYSEATFLQIGSPIPNSAGS